MDTARHLQGYLALLLLTARDCITDGDLEEACELLVDYATQRQHSQAMFDEGCEPTLGQWTGDRYALLLGDAIDTAVQHKGRQWVA